MPTATIFEGCFIRFDQVISLTCTKPLDALFELDESAVIGNADHPALHPRPDRVTLRGVQPRVGRELLEAQRNALLVLVELQNLHLNLIAHLHQVVRMRQPPPRHIGNVQQSVDSAQVDESAVVGQVLHRSGQHRALCKLLHRLVALAGEFFFQHLLAADDDVAALLVQFNDANLDVLAFQGVEIADRPGVDLRAGQKCARAHHVNRQPALDPIDDANLNGRLVVVRLFNLVPGVETLCLLVRKIYVALFGVTLFDHHVNLVAGLESDITFVVLHLGQRHDAFGFQSDVHDKVVRVNTNDNALEDAVLIGSQFTLFLLE